MITSELILDPARREFPEFSLSRLLSSVFDPVAGCRIGIITDLNRLDQMKDFGFLEDDSLPAQRKAYEVFHRGLLDGVMDKLGMTGGEMYGHEMTNGSNLDLPDACADTEGRILSLEKDVYPNYDLLLCIGTWSATAPLTEKCKIHGFRGATMHGVNDVILNSGLAVDYEDVSRDAEKLRLALTRADEIEIDFGLEDGRVLTSKLVLNGQEAQKSHGLCRGTEPDIANLPAGEVYFVPESAEGQFPLKYEDGTLGVLDVEERDIVSSTLIEGNQATIDDHNDRLRDDPMTGTLGELGFGTQILPVSGSDIQDEKVLGTCHLATGRDDHLGGDIVPSMFKKHENSTHDDILFAPHKTPNFSLTQVRMKRGDQREILIEDFKPSAYLVDALLADS